MTNPIRSTMELRGLVWMSWIDLKWNHIKGINGYSSNDGWMVEEDPRKILIWIFNRLYVGLDGLCGN